jgi:acetylornithine deacetylase
VHFAFSYEEEIGCFGVRELIADLRDAGIKPLACIVGEPTSMVPAIAHKGVYRYKCCVRGKEAHSSLTPQSVNAIEMAARLVGKVRDMAEGFEREEPRYEGFDVPFCTASVGQFHGGIADNVVPRDAEFRYEFRDLPTADAKAMQAQVMAHARSLEPAMQKVAPDAGFSFETICEIPSFLGSAQDPVTRLALRLAREQRTTHGGVRHRGRAVQERGHPHRGVRPRQHRAGAPA